MIYLHIQHLGLFDTCSRRYDDGINKNESNTSSTDKMKHLEATDAHYIVRAGTGGTAAVLFVARFLPSMTSEAKTIILIILRMFTETRSFSVLLLKPCISFVPTSSV